MLILGFFTCSLDYNSLIGYCFSSNTASLDGTIVKVNLVKLVGFFSFLFLKSMTRGKFCTVNFVIVAA